MRRPRARPQAEWWGRADETDMGVHQATFSVRTNGQGMLEITDSVAREVQRSGLKQGVVTVFCQHTSCSLVIMENADPTARSDLEAWLDRLVPEQDRHF